MIGKLQRFRIRTYFVCAYQISCIFWICNYYDIKRKKKLCHIIIMGSNNSRQIENEEKWIYFQTFYVFQPLE